MSFCVEMVAAIRVVSGKKGCEGGGHDEWLGAVYTVLCFSGGRTLERVERLL